MDQIKIGKFIAEMRKEQDLTQQDLAERLGISNKTVSKWECGNGMPDYAVMESLCQILKININELLSGEHLPSQEYSKKAEENMMSLMQESSENYKRDRVERTKFIIGIMMLSILLVLTIIMWGGSPAISYFIDAPIFIHLIVITVLVMGISDMFKDFIKAFPLALKKYTSTEGKQLRKSILAVKTAILTINTVGVLSCGIGIVIMFGKLDDWGSIGSHILVAILSVLYALVMTLLFIPIYVRLKNKLEEE